MMVDGIRRLKPVFVRLLLIAVASVLLVMILVAIARPEAPKVDDFDSCVEAGGALTASRPQICVLNGQSFTKPVQNSQSSQFYVGKTEDEALKAAAESGEVARVVERDGRALPVTMDFVVGRLNLYIREGQVYRVDIESQSAS